MVTDRPAQEIEVTEEMLKAGEDALQFEDKYDVFDVAARREVVRQVFIAMYSRAPLPSVSAGRQSSEALEG
jgi:hypothetical protein